MGYEDVGLIVHAIGLQDFQPVWSGSTNVTDGQTDKSYGKMCHVHSGKNTRDRGIARPRFAL